ncbi:RteC domain-containing protein [Mucilaginibacter sp. NFX135]|uniref:RteC domain-containing protein n=1 Tax=Mucilaginibacter sp. NFX135 TaxID=3402687 RepID=UPI003AFB5B2D
MHLPGHPFAHVQEEIDFFKRVKPQFDALRIYYIGKYDLEIRMPVADTESLKEFYREELRTLQRFFRHVCFYYEYYRLGATELDRLYFVRGAEAPGVLLPELPDQDPGFSTAGDYLFAKIIAYERLQGDLLRAVGALDPAYKGRAETAEELPALKWTGDKVNLVEVIYAIYFTGQLNHGNADLSLIIRFMEKHLEIDLSRAYRDFIDIRNRKISSPSRYIDQMRESIHKRVDDDLAFKVSRKNSSKPGGYG